MPTDQPTSGLSPAAVARLIDHTLLKPEATAADVQALVAEAVELGTYAVCVSPSMLPVAVPAGSGLKVAAVGEVPGRVDDHGALAGAG